MAPVHHHSNNHENTKESQESSGLIVKLYSHLMTNSTVQNGIKQITRLSQPLIDRFEPNIVRLAGNVRRWVASENIYNQLSSLWLSQNLPFEGNTVSYETFALEARKMARSDKKHQFEHIAKIFYNFSAEVWKALQDPDFEDIKNAVLVAVAKTINQANHFQNETLATALYNMLRMLIEKRRELVSSETYFNLVKLTMGDEYYNSNQQVIRAVCYLYYAFAKTFLLIDFPLATNNRDFLKLITHFIQDSSFCYGDSTLNFIEKRLDILLKLTGQKNKEYLEDNTITEKAQRILRKIYCLSTFPLKKVEDVLHQVQGTQAYTTLERHLHINERIDHTLHLTALGYNMLKENLLQPSITTFKVIRNQAKSRVTVVINGLDVQLLKKSYTKLRAKYQVLQKCAVIVVDETVKIVFDKQALTELEENGKKELFRVYNELKDMEKEKIKAVGMDYYCKILKKAQETYHNASKAVYYKKRALGDVEGAALVRPSNDPEVDAYDNSSHSDNMASKNATETVALAAAESN